MAKYYDEKWLYTLQFLAGPAMDQLYNPEWPIADWLTHWVMKLHDWSNGRVSFPIPPLAVTHSEWIGANSFYYVLRGHLQQNPERRSLSAGLRVTCDNQLLCWHIHAWCDIQMGDTLKEKLVQIWMLDPYSEGGILLDLFGSTCPFRGKGHCNSILY